jgi:Fe-S cluster assembly iron-binding protein IscA
MLSVTDAALEHVKSLLDAANRSASTKLRVFIGPSGAQFRFDYPRPGDHFYSCDGQKVLICDDFVVEYLRSQTIDVKRGPNGIAFVVAQQEASPAPIQGPEAARPPSTPPAPA